MSGPVRPYVITGGRSGTNRPALAIESLVSAVPAADLDPDLRSGDTLNREHQRILALCHDLLSVAEVAAHLRLPVSVVRVLVDDLWDLGAVQVRPPAPQADRLPTHLLEEVLVGLRQLR
ncbi:DUF742 domain-containing protein [Kitasatospora sp. NPDC048540]|uniref:DUF742 domain-containing protein n=1 Tax=unclassified Kitasatospora TaxID=2633591 RepID=UPI000539DF0B|nr:DUF742 domain-containing protein [Kitasatospora sp. MBT63]